MKQTENAKSIEGTCISRREGTSENYATFDKRGIQGAKLWWPRITQ